MTHLRSIIAATALYATLLTTMVPAHAAMFTDTSRSVFQTQIAWLGNEGVATGYADGTFRPYEAATRGDTVGHLYRLAGSPSYTAPAVSAFKDVSMSDPNYKAIHWAERMGITTGYSDGTFKPAAKIERGAMMAFLHRFSGKLEGGTKVFVFKDVTTSTPHYDAIQWAAREGITTGWSDGTFRPSENVTREQMAVFLYRTVHNVGLWEFIGEPVKPLPGDAANVTNTTGSEYYTVK